MARTPIIGGNWKMHLDLAEATRLAAGLRSAMGAFRTADVVVFPSFAFLHPVHGKLRDSAIRLGAQDLHPEPKGAYTSGVSASMLRSVGATAVLIGHSERRAHFRDVDALVASKLGAAISAGLQPVLCIGESLSEREGGHTFDVLARQLDSALAGQTPHTLATLVVAYEPVWAIGTGKTASPAQAQEVHSWIRTRVASRLGVAFADALRLQYGGSVKPDNAAALMSQPDIDGALVGGASLDEVAFARIIRAAAAA